MPVELRVRGYSRKWTGRDGRLTAVPAHNLIEFARAVGVREWPVSARWTSDEKGNVLTPAAYQYWKELLEAVGQNPQTPGNPYGVGVVNVPEEDAVGLIRGFEFAEVPFFDPDRVPELADYKERGDLQDQMEYLDTLVEFAGKQFYEDNNGRTLRSSYTPDEGGFSLGELGTQSYFAPAQADIEEWKTWLNSTERDGFFATPGELNAPHWFLYRLDSSLVHPNLGYHKDPTDLTLAGAFRAPPGPDLDSCWLPKARADDWGVRTEREVADFREAWRIAGLAVPPRSEESVRANQVLDVFLEPSAHRSTVNAQRKYQWAPSNSLTHFIPEVIEIKANFLRYGVPGRVQSRDPLSYSTFYDIFPVRGLVQVPWARGNYTPQDITEAQNWLMLFYVKNNGEIVDCSRAPAELDVVGLRSERFLGRRIPHEAQVFLTDYARARGGAFQSVRQAPDTSRDEPGDSEELFSRDDQVRLAEIMSSFISVVAVPDRLKRERVFSVLRHSNGTLYPELTDDPLDRNILRYLQLTLPDEDYKRWLAFSQRNRHSKLPRNHVPLGDIARMFTPFTRQWWETGVQGEDTKKVFGYETHATPKNISRVLLHIQRLKVALRRLKRQRPRVMRAVSGYNDCLREARVLKQRFVDAAGPNSQREIREEAAENAEKCEAQRATLKRIAGASGITLREDI